MCRGTPPGLLRSVPVRTIPASEALVAIDVECRHKQNSNVIEHSRRNGAAENFPQRNRLIAGLVSGVVIVEAAMRSGSLITARLANEMGRDIFALPGSIHAPLSRGCHRIIKQGAKLVETPDEVLEELGFATGAAVRAAPAPQRTVAWDGQRSPNEGAVGASPGAQPNLPTAHARRTVATDLGATGTPSAAAVDSTTARTGVEAQSESPAVAATPVTVAATTAFADAVALPPASAADVVDSEAQRLLAALGHSPTTLEILATRTEMEEAALQTTLLQLELAGQITVLPGGRFMRVTHSRPRLDQG